MPAKRVTIEFNFEHEGDQETPTADSTLGLRRLGNETRTLPIRHPHRGRSSRRLLEIWQFWIGMMNLRIQISRELC